MRKRTCQAQFLRFPDFVGNQVQGRLRISPIAHDANGLYTPGTDRLLRSGAARETEDRMPVGDDVVERTKPHLLPIYQAIVLILREHESDV
ncbi:MAG: hypothetical protein FWE95_04565 [Planctomycetaceae bacterium]|nr:hypothetical protein [Planctomycetaceae bacterium]